MDIKPKIVVAGSSNTDMVVKVPHIPAPGRPLWALIFDNTRAERVPTRQLLLHVRELMLPLLPVCRMMHLETVD
jgi:hypothetical protein